LKTAIFCGKGNLKYRSRFSKEIKMKREGILLAAVVLLGAAGFAQAQDEPLGVTVDATWVSKYLWRGFDLLDDKGAFQPSVDVDLFGSGFSVNVWASYPTSVGTMNKGTATPASRVDATEFNYRLAYDMVLDESEDWATAVRVQTVYRDFIDIYDEAADDVEVGVQIAMPNLCPAGFVPSYYVGKIWPAAGKSGTNSAGTRYPDLHTSYGGWVHIFGVSYDLTVEGLMPDTPEQIITLSAAAVYNDGFTDPRAFAAVGNAGAVDHDWSHALFGVSTEFELAENVSLTPALYYQSSWDDSVNPEDELWVSVGASCRF
jgi:hypothetical protein